MKRWLTHKHDVIIHVEEVFEASRGILDYILRHDLEEENWKHPRRLATWAGMLDGIGPALYRGGAHRFIGTWNAQASGFNFSNVKTEFGANWKFVELVVHKPDLYQ
jgi:hypothetical protein